MNKKKFLIIAVLGLVLGSLFLFPTKKFLKENNLLLGLRYNDHVLVGTLAFILSIIAFYKLTIRKK